VVAIVLGTLTIFGLAIERAGFTLSTVFLLLVLFGPVARKRWWVALVAALAVAVVARIIARSPWRPCTVSRSACPSRSSQPTSSSASSASSSAR
jgi:hypothetical protein